MEENSEGNVETTKQETNQKEFFLVDARLPRTRDAPASDIWGH